MTLGPDKENLEKRWNDDSYEQKKIFEELYFEEKKITAKLGAEIVTLKKNNSRREFFPRLFAGSGVSIVTVGFGHWTHNVSNALYGFGVIIFLVSAYPGFMEPVIAGISKLFKRPFG